MTKLCAVAFLSFGLAVAAEPPQAEISNGSIRAKLYLPDPENGYYRATRFDWSGVISDLEYKGHNYFGKWFEKYDPKIHDAISGPVEEFRTNGSGLGYEEAKVGETFVRIGVGVLRKPEEPRFGQFKTYEIVDSGKWTVRKGADWVEFNQELTGPNGYAYLYRKTVRLAKDQPRMTLEHSLKNTGKRAIESNVYNHNFFVIDGRSSGPGFVIRFPFELKADRDLKSIAEVRGREVVYVKEIEKGQSIITNLKGFSDSAKDYDIRVENSDSGAGVRVTCDRPLSDVVFWSIRTVLSPEAYISMRIEPGSEFTWNINYDFYTLPAAGKQ
jgi:hypothetical protein